MKRIRIYDTTLRDGAQAEEISFSLLDKLQLTKRLAALGFDYVEGGYPASNEKDAEYFHRVAQESLGSCRVSAFGMTRRKGAAVDSDAGLIQLLECGASVITLVGKASYFQATEILRVSADENLSMIAQSISMLTSHGREVIYDAEHFFDGWKSNPQYALETLRAARDAGASTLVLCDTNGGCMPEEIAAGTRAAVELGVPVGIHCHNDCDMAVANSIMAVRAGADMVQGTLNGVGERCGNANLISVIANLVLKCGYDVLNPEAIGRLTELSRFMYEMVNLPQPANMPYVGRSAFAHKGGMHVSAMARNTSSYEHVAPQWVGNERRVLISELSGRSNIMAMAEKHHIANDPKLMERILARVVSRERDGYQYEAAAGSFDLLVKECAGSFKPHFERIKYHVNVVATPDGKVVTEAFVKIRIGEIIRYEVAEGDGPINALDAAVRKALNGNFPSIQKTQLVDYKVRVINSEAATAAGVRVVIESRDEHDSWGTVGVSENVIEASWIALVDSFEYKLCKDDA